MEVTTRRGTALRHLGEALLLVNIVVAVAVAPHVEVLVTNTILIAIEKIHAHLVTAVADASIVEELAGRDRSSKEESWKMS